MDALLSDKLFAETQPVDPFRTAENLLRAFYSTALEAVKMPSWRVIRPAGAPNEETAMEEVATHAAKEGFDVVVLQKQRTSPEDAAFRMLKIAENRRAIYGVTQSTPLDGVPQGKPLLVLSAGYTATVGLREAFARNLSFACEIHRQVVDPFDPQLTPPVIAFGGSLDERMSKAVGVVLSPTTYAELGPLDTRVKNGDYQGVPQRLHELRSWVEHNNVSTYPVDLDIRMMIMAREPAEHSSEYLQAYLGREGASLERKAYLERKKQQPAKQWLALGLC
jgi:hypothetical protein